MDLKEFIVNRAEALGIDIVGFTTLEAFDNLREFLYERRNKEYETEFEEKDIEARIKPKVIMEEGKSIIAIGMSYNIDFFADNENINGGRLSRSSWGLDYHKVLRDKMQELVDEIVEITEFKYNIFVDTGPLIDREVAKRAGIGWYGKNCSIINEKYGSFIFIGYIMTDLDIESDRHAEEGCGDCRRCIKACPTGALEDNYRLNPKRCISYLTQTKNDIPYELREKMGTKIYGCDTCQEACPKNKTQHKTQNPAFFPHSTGSHIDINKLFELTDKEFKQKYGEMSGSWRGKNILKRNALIILGNKKDKQNIEILEKALESPSLMLRKYAAWALLRIDYEIGERLIRKSASKEKDLGVINEYNRLIDYYKDDSGENRNNI